MGVHGLWRLIEPSGKPVPLETLENKILAVDVSIWIHQAVKGFQDSRGQPLPNAHLLGIYHRVCKLLYFKIRPVFVFDGGVPALKKETIAKRNQQKSKNVQESNKLQKQLLNTLLKHSAVSKVLSEKAKTNIETSINAASTSDKRDIYALPPSANDSISSSEDDSDFEIESSSETTTTDSSPTRNWDIHTIDLESSHFRSLPADVRHEILTEMKETRKQSSWGRLHELPTQSDDFAVFQMNRLRKRYKVQVGLEQAEQEMGGHSLSLGELETLLNDQGVITNNKEFGNRIASDENTRYLLIKDLKRALEKAKQNEGIPEEDEETSKNESADLQEAIKLSLKSNSPKEISLSVKDKRSKADEELENDLKKAVKLSLENQPSTSRIETEVDRNEEKTSDSGTKKTNEEEIFDSGTMKTNEEKSVDNSVKKTNAKHVLPDLSLQERATEQTKTAETVAAKETSNNKLDETSFTQVETESHPVAKSVADEEFENDLQKAIKLSLECEELRPETIDVFQSGPHSETIEEDSDEEEMSASQKILASAKNYMMEYSGLTPAEINKIIGCSANKKKHSNKNILNSKSSEDVKKSDITNVSSNQNSKSIDFEKQAIAINSDDSSSDEFVEVNEPFTTNKDESSKIEVVVKHVDALEDDLFADIFSTEDKNDLKTVESVREIEKEKDNTGQVKDTTEKIENDKIKVEGIAKENLIAGSSETGETSSVRQQIITEKPIVTVEELKQMQSDLSRESKELLSERSTKERLAGNITDQMYQEAQELLQLFGVPYVIAPMEAEAQCAFLDEINLTDGTITDDSDIWLFGGKTVYKNFFNQSKHVMEFCAENIQHLFKLTREQMILLALLVGSDYTTGIPGIGPVTALEILAAFPSLKSTEFYLSHQQLLSGLHEFRKWLNGQKTQGPSRISLRNKLRNVRVLDNFPSLQVVQAYMDPKVETSKEAFSWAKPDIVGLTDFAREKFGWTRTKSEELLKPVLKRLEEKHLQKSIKDFFKTESKVDSGNAESQMSKRVKRAIDRIGKGKDTDEEDVALEKSKPKQRKKESSDATESKEKKAPRKPKKDNMTKEQKRKPRKKQDEDIEILKQTKARSVKKVEEIESAIKNEIAEKEAKKREARNLHMKEVIPQKEMDKAQLLKRKMKAIETFRKSKQGPGYVKKRGKVVRQQKEDAELSESSSSD